MLQSAHCVINIFVCALTYSGNVHAKGSLIWIYKINWNRYANDFLSQYPHILNASSRSIPELMRDIKFNYK